jgi:DNA-binding NarL/FixJ family response regulator
MEPQILIAGQIAIDIILLVVFLWVIRAYRGRPAPNVPNETSIRESEKILAEIHQISRDLDENLEEKKLLSRNLLGELEKKLKQAEERAAQLSRLIQDSRQIMKTSGDTSHETGQTRSSVFALLEKGLSKEEIARHLGISVGEIELLLKLR